MRNHTSSYMTRFVDNADLSAHDIAVQANKTREKHPADLSSNCVIRAAAILLHTSPYEVLDLFSKHNLSADDVRGTLLRLARVQDIFREESLLKSIASGIWVFPSGPNVWHAVPVEQLHCGSKALPLLEIAPGEDQWIGLDDMVQHLDNTNSMNRAAAGLQSLDIGFAPLEGHTDLPEWIAQLRGLEEYLPFEYYFDRHEIGTEQGSNSAMVRHIDFESKGRGDLHFSLERLYSSLNAYVLKGQFLINQERKKYLEYLRDIADTIELATKSAICDYYQPFFADLHNTYKNLIFVKERLDVDPIPAMDWDWEVLDLKVHNDPQVLYDRVMSVNWPHWTASELFVFFPNGDWECRYDVPCLELGVDEAGDFIWPYIVDFLQPTYYEKHQLVTINPIFYAKYINGEKVYAEGQVNFDWAEIVAANKMLETYQKCQQVIREFKDRIEEELAAMLEDEKHLAYQDSLIGDGWCFNIPFIRPAVAPREAGTAPPFAPAHPGADGLIFFDGYRRRSYGQSTYAEFYQEKAIFKHITEDEKRILAQATGQYSVHQEPDYDNPPDYVSDIEDFGLITDITYRIEQGGRYHYFDSLGRLRYVTDYTHNNQIEYSYRSSENNQLASIRDSAGNEYQFSYAYVGIEGSYGHAYPACEMTITAFDRLGNAYRKNVYLIKGTQEIDWQDAMTPTGFYQQENRILVEVEEIAFDLRSDSTPVESGESHTTHYEYTAQLFFKGDVPKYVEGFIRGEGDLDTQYKEIELPILTSEVNPTGGKTDFAYHECQYQLYEVTMRPSVSLFEESSVVWAWYQLGGPPEVNRMYQNQTLVLAHPRIEFYAADDTPHTREGTVGHRVQSAKWTEGWTTANFYTVGGKTYLFLLKEKGTGADGYNVRIHRMNQYGTVGSRVQSYKWTEGWTTANFFTVGGKTYLFLLKEKRTGTEPYTLHIHVMNQNGTVGDCVQSSDGTEGWTTATFYTVDGKTYLFLLMEKGTDADGYNVRVYRMNQTGTVGSRVQSYNWTEGWTTANSYTVDDKTYLFLLKEKGTGADGNNVHIHEMNQDGTVGSRVQSYKWTEGWTTANFYTVDDKTYLFLLKEKGAGADGNNVHIHEMNQDGTVGSRVQSRKWTEGWTTANFYTVGGKTYLFLLMEKGTDADGNNVHIHEMNQKGSDRKRCYTLRPDRVEAYTYHQYRFSDRDNERFFKLRRKDIWSVSWKAFQYIPQQGSMWRDKSFTEFVEERHYVSFLQSSLDSLLTSEEFFYDSYANLERKKTRWETAVDSPHYVEVSFTYLPDTIQQRLYALPHIVRISDSAQDYRTIQYKYHSIYPQSIFAIEGDIKRQEFAYRNPEQDPGNSRKPTWIQEEKGPVFTRFWYDQKGNLVKLTDAEGHETRYTHEDQVDDSGRAIYVIKTIRSRSDQEILGELYEKASNKPLSRSDWQIVEELYEKALNKPLGRSDREIVEELYEKALNKPLSHSDREIVEALIENAFGQPLKRIDANGNVTQYVYDGFGRLVGTLYPNGGYTTLEYDNHTTTICRNHGNDPREYYRTVVFADDFGNLITIKEYTGALLGAFGGWLRSFLVWAAKWFGIRRFWDWPNITTTIQYDERNRVKSVYREGAHAHIDYDPLDRVVSSTDFRGGTVITAYDDALKSRQIRYREYQDPEQPIEIKAALKTVTDPEGHTTEYYYDGLGRILCVKKQCELDYGQATKDVYWRWEWDNRSRKVSETLPNGLRTDYTYDQYDRLVEKRKSDGLQSIVEGFPQYNKIHQLRCYVDPRGNETWYEYDTLDRLTSIRRPLEDMRLFKYDNNGNVTRVIHNGRQSHYTYNELDQITSSQDPEGNLLVYGYDPLGRLTSQTDPYQHVKTWEYNSRDLLVRYTNEAGHSYSWDYNEYNGLCWSREPGGPETERTYQTNDAGDVVEIRNSKDEVIRIGRDLFGRPNTITVSGLNLTYQYAYDRNNKLKSIRYPNSAIWRYQHNELGQLTQIRSPECRVRNFEYDAFGRLRQSYLTRFPNQSVVERWEFRHDDNNNLIEVRGPLWKLAEYQYDELDRLSAIVPFGNPGYDDYDLITGKRPRIVFDHDHLNQTVTLTDINGHNVEILMDGNSQVRSIVNQTGQRTWYGRDKLGRINHLLISSNNLISDPTDPSSYPDDTSKYYSQQMDYYPSGELERIRYGDGTEVKYTYDVNGNLLSYTDENGLVTAIENDLVSNLPRTITGPDGYRRRIERDALGRVTFHELGGSEVNVQYLDLANELVVTQASGRTTEYAFHPDGYLRSIKKPDTGVSYFTYNLAGRLYQVTNALDEAYRYWSNEHGSVRRMFVKRAGSNTFAGTQEAIAYHPDGSIGSRTSPAGTIRYQYHQDGTLKRITYGDDSWEEYTYYEDGLVKQIDYSDGGNKTYKYNHLGNITEISENGEKVTIKRDHRQQVLLEEVSGCDEVYDIEYYPNGECKRIRNIHYIRNPDTGLLEEVRYVNDDGEVMFNLNHQYYPNGWLRKRHTAEGYYQTFKYDGDGRPVEVRSNSGVFSISYDTNGNPNAVTRVDAGGSPVTDNYTYDEENRLRFINKGTPQEIEFGYDAMGNLVYEHHHPDHVVKKRTHNSYNQLETISENGELATSLGYDARGNLTLVDSVNGLKIGYRYDRQNRLRRIYSLNSAGERVILNEYSYDAADRLKSDNPTEGPQCQLRHATVHPVSLEKDGHKIAVIPDLDNLTVLGFVLGHHASIPNCILGNSTYHQDTSGTLLSRQEWTPYGYDKQNASEYNPFGYKGYYQSESGLHWAFTRYYSHEVKHFLSPDILPGNPFRPLSMNRNRVFSANPMRYMDILGLADNGAADDWPYETVVVGKKDKPEPKRKIQSKGHFMDPQERIPYRGLPSEGSFALPDLTEMDLGPQPAPFPEWPDLPWTFDPVSNEWLPPLLPIPGKKRKRPGKKRKRRKASPRKKRVPRRSSKYKARHAYNPNKFQVEIDEQGRIKVKKNDWLSKYSAFLHDGDMSRVDEYERRGDGGYELVANVDLIYEGETLYHQPTRLEYEEATGEVIDREKAHQKGGFADPTGEWEEWEEKRRYYQEEGGSWLVLFGPGASTITIDILKNMVEFWVTPPLRGEGPGWEILRGFEGLGGAVVVVVSAVPALGLGIVLDMFKQWYDIIDIATGPP